MRGTQPMILSFKTRLKTDNRLSQFLLCCCGARRFVYNRSLALWQEMYAEGSKPNASKVRNKLRERIRGGEYSFLKKYPNMVLENAIDDLDKSFDSFFKKQSRFPKFKRKGRCAESFRIHKKNGTTFRVGEDRSHLRIPRLPKGYLLRLHEDLPERIQDIRTVTVSRRAGEWYVSITYGFEVEEYCGHTHERVGIDLGLTTFAFTSDGERFILPKEKILSIESKISKMQKSLSKKVKGSERRAIVRLKIQRLYERKRNVLHDSLHKFSTQLCRKYRKIAMEDLNVAGMLKNHKLAKSIVRSAWGTFRSMMEYKSTVNGTILIMADRFFPSSKMCSRCGTVKQGLTLSDRIYSCGSCGSQMDRDLNASMNLEALC